MSISRVAVVGAGLIGVALAREITRRFPDAEVTVLDRADRVAAAQSGHTAGIVHAGLTEEPGTLEAKLARRGLELLIPYAAGQGIALRECGQLVVAQDTDEVDRLEDLLTRAEKTGVPGVRMVDRAEMREIEPQARGVQALYSPHTAITDYSALAEALAADVREAGGRFRFGTEVTGLDVMSNEVRVRARNAPTDEDGSESSETGYSTDLETMPGERPHTDDDQVVDRPRTYRGDDGEPQVEPGRGGRGGRLGEELHRRFGDRDWFRSAEDKIDEWTGTKPVDRNRPTPPAEFDAGVFDLVFVAVGLQSDRLAAAAGLDPEPRVVPFASSYSQLVPPAAEAVHGIIGSVPDPVDPLEETMLVRTVDGALLLGPTTHIALGRNAGSARDIDFGDLGASFGFSGFWKFAKRNVRSAAEGVRSATSTSAFVERIKRFAPDLDTTEMTAGPRGIRAATIDAKGDLVTGLTVTTRGRLTQVRSVPASGATMALAIAEHIVERAQAAGR
ncbi:FAD-dependent oxidoreductase [Brevibacterium sp. XM4083]|uniref:FAD-dependent oxidoreductase n=1 Tax=Brevibacterium sp. XM4083 TaxID=2583238 RepID=UPI0020307826|nr:FAD-dependent oxidoreductase [Brevibacterium sp. XM4083]MCM1012958.1 FAD-dependent oxidoreductase [Brevibacterium sp. XM4083]